MTAALLVLSLAAAASVPEELRTTAEQTGWVETGRYAEVERICQALARLHPRRARCDSFGTSPAGRPMLALVLSDDGTLDERGARARRRPVLLVQGAIHAGELDGKDAFLEVARDLLAEPAGGPLGRVTVVMVPVLNVDGHERFGKNQRPNQRGPVETGWRTTAQNLNLNRDYVKADAPETRALLALLRAWDPVLYADFHVTDGAKFEHDVSIIIEPRLGYAEGLRSHGEALQRALSVRLERQGHLPIDFYPAFQREDDPASGFAVGVAMPRFGSSYWAARNRLGVLVEAHSWRTYKERVAIARDVLRGLIDQAAERGAAWREAAGKADAADAALAAQPLVLRWETAPASTAIRFRGYAYQRFVSPVSGGNTIRYDESKRQVWEIPLRNAVRPVVQVTMPAGGWIVPAPVAAPVAERLQVHGISSEWLAGPRHGVAAEVFRASSAAFEPKSFEGRQGLAVKGGWAREEVELDPGALWVPVAQPSARLAAYLLEPGSPDSLLAWGFFNGWFERKELIEDYVLEPWAEALLAGDASVKAEFEARLASDPAFARDREARLEFFAARHPSRDDAWRRYPVVRVAARP